MGEAQPLTDLQLAILRVLWDRGTATAAEITEALKESRGLAQQTIATILTRLEKRGIVTHETRQRQYIYTAVLSEPEVRRTLHNPFHHLRPHASHLPRRVTFG